MTTIKAVDQIIYNILYNIYNKSHVWPFWNLQTLK